MEEDKYRTVNAIAEGLYKEKGSRFISFIYPVKTEEEIKDILTEIKTKYYDARHHCYAYCLGANRERFRANDDGEPSSTAGKPILGQIVSNDLSNVLVVVVRYFGGIKLGVSGLIQAYRDAAANAILHAEIVERTVDEEIRIRFTYVVMNDVMKVLKEEEPEVLSRNFEMECEMTLSIRQKDMPRLKERLLKIESLAIEE
ncbi:MULTISPECIES: IMPACT family protein [Butyricimonas]|uniref:IMPACT family protein n=1 Tax=Butyricimonas TaxID=574697 RepID=UPI001D063FD5|nr:MULTISPECIES: YigZ family protein [Butyricimonas]MCB6973206.1 YigZ family protein [Butyricimonas synergistica]MCG4519876.1 YigZ family protein [Butyricimonas sp. DFI.6.44]